MPCLELTGVKMTKPFQLIPFKQLQLLLSQGKGIETVPCSPQDIDSFVLSIHDNAQVVCKSMTLSEIESDSDSNCCPNPSWNPNCMTILDWVKVQAEDQVIYDLIQWYRTKELHRGQDTDSLEIKQFLQQRVKLLGIMQQVQSILLNVWMQTASAY